MFDVSKLSLKELQELQAQITKEKKKRGSCNKTAVYSPHDQKLFDVVGAGLKRVPGAVIKDMHDGNQLRLADAVRSSALKMCDVAFMNVNVNSKGTVVMHSGPDLYLVGDSIDAYKEMYERIIKIFFEYATYYAYPKEV